MARRVVKASVTNRAAIRVRNPGRMAARGATVVVLVPAAVEAEVVVVAAAAVNAVRFAPVRPATISSIPAASRSSRWFR